MAVGNPETIKLHYTTDQDGNLRLVDQHGRMLAGVRALTVDTAHDGVDSARVEVLMHNADGQPYVGGKR